MSLIRRRKSPTPAERSLGILRLGLKGLAAQRVARRAYGGYKFARKLPFLLALGGVAFVVLKKVRSGSSQPDVAPTTPPTPAPGPTSSSNATAAPSAPPAVTPPEPTTTAPEVVAVPDDAAPAPVEPETIASSHEPEATVPGSPTLDLSEIVESEATVPAHPSPAGTGGAQGEGVPTDEESAAASGESSDAAPPAKD